MRGIATIAALVGVAAASGAMAQDYRPPAVSVALLAKVDLAHARPVDEAYRRLFTVCDGLMPGGKGKDTFRGHRTPRRCSSDPSTVKALLKLPDGGVLWESKVALDVDGSYAATSGIRWLDAKRRVRNTTDQCGTALQWRKVRVSDCKDAEAQVDPDLFPYVAVPGAATGFLPKAERVAAQRAFGKTIGISLRDMGVIVYRDRWTPVFVADVGPVFRLGEASSGAFAALGQSRCRVALAADRRCRGDASRRYPYVDAGLPAGAIFILYPGSGAGLTRENAIARICALARDKLGLTGSPVCTR